MAAVYCDSFTTHHGRGGVATSEQVCKLRLDSLGELYVSR